MECQRMGLTTLLAQAGITEHAVMFPVDSIKVRTSIFIRLSCAMCICVCREASWTNADELSAFGERIDSDAGLRHLAIGGVYRHRECVHSHFQHRGRACALEGRILCDHGRRACARRPLRRIRGREGAGGRQRGGQPECMACNMYVVSVLLGELGLTEPRNSISRSICNNSKRCADEPFRW